MGVIIFSEEEKEEYKQIILDRLLDGISYRELSSYVGINEATIRKYTKELVEERKNYLG